MLAMIFVNLIMIFAVMQKQVIASAAETAAAAADDDEYESGAVPGPDSDSRHLSRPLFNHLGSNVLSLINEYVAEPQILAQTARDFRELYLQSNSFALFVRIETAETGSKKVDSVMIHRIAETIFESGRMHECCSRSRPASASASAFRTMDVDVDPAPTPALDATNAWLRFEARFTDVRGCATEDYLSFEFNQFYILLRFAITLERRETTAGKQQIIIVPIEYVAQLYNSLRHNPHPRKPIRIEIEFHRKQLRINNRLLAPDMQQYLWLDIPANPTFNAMKFQLYEHQLLGYKSDGHQLLTIPIVFGNRNAEAADADFYSHVFASASVPAHAKSIEFPDPDFGRGRSQFGGVREVNIKIQFYENILVCIVQLLFFGRHHVQDSPVFLFDFWKLNGSRLDFSSDLSLAQAQAQSQSLTHLAQRRLKALPPMYDWSYSLNEVDFVPMKQDTIEDIIDGDWLFMSVVERSRSTILSYNLASGEESVIDKHGKWGALRAIIHEMNSETETESDEENAVLVHYIHPYAVIRTQNKEGEDDESDSDSEFKSNDDKGGVEWHFWYFDASSVGWQSRLRTLVPVRYGYDQLQMRSNIQSVIASQNYKNSYDFWRRLPSLGFGFGFDSSCLGHI